MFTRSGLVIYVRRYAECVAFYRDALSLSVMFTTPDLTCFDLGGGYLMVEPVADHAPPSRDGGPAACLRLHVADVAAAARRLRDRGVEVDLQSHSWGCVAKFLDPDGNLCAFKDDATFEAQVSAGP